MVRIQGKTQCATAKRSGEMAQGVVCNDEVQAIVEILIQGWKFEGSRGHGHSRSQDAWRDAIGERTYGRHIIYVGNSELENSVSSL